MGACVWRIPQIYFWVWRVSAFFASGCLSIYGTFCMLWWEGRGERALYPPPCMTKYSSVCFKHRTRRLVKHGSVVTGRRRRT